MGRVSTDGTGDYLEPDDGLFEWRWGSGWCADGNPRGIELFSGFGEAEAEEGVDSGLEWLEGGGAAIFGSIFEGDFESLESASQFKPGRLGCDWRGSQADKGGDEDG